jgi:NAD(P)H-dependent flavin oxidoreductase YrpB (nitropropane dioxygenase family)
LAGRVITTVAAVKLVARAGGLADGAGVLGAADPDDWLRAAMAATHVPTTTEAFAAAVV